MIARAITRAEAEASLRTAQTGILELGVRRSPYLKPYILAKAREVVRAA